MNTATFDTHRFIKRLDKTGMPLTQAEEVVDIVSEAIEARNAEPLHALKMQCSSRK